MGLVSARSGSTLLFFQFRQIENENMGQQPSECAWLAQCQARQIGRQFAAGIAPLMSSNGFPERLLELPSLSSGDVVLPGEATPTVVPRIMRRPFRMGPRPGKVGCAPESFDQPVILLHSVHRRMELAPRGKQALIRRRHGRG